MHKCDIFFRKHNVKQGCLCGLTVIPLRGLFAPPQLGVDEAVTRVFFFFLRVGCAVTFHPLATPPVPNVRANDCGVTKDFDHHHGCGRRFLVVSLQTKV